MVVLGGVTRLTGSGLSMVDWRPLMGVLPPMSEAEWLRVFEMYQKSPDNRYRLPRTFRFLFRQGLHTALRVA
jgi:heme A synthase